MFGESAQPGSDTRPPPPPETRRKRSDCLWSDSLRPWPERHSPRAGAPSTAMDNTELRRRPKRCPPVNLTGARITMGAARTPHASVKSTSGAVDPLVRRQSKGLGQTARREQGTNAHAPPAPIASQGRRSPSPHPNTSTFCCYRDTRRATQVQARTVLQWTIQN